MRVLVECYPDRALVLALGVPKRQLRHERCKGEVVKRVRKLDDVTGIVDEDPASAQPHDLNNYDIAAEVEGLRLLSRRDQRNRRMVVICPRLEDWLLQRARASGVEPQDHGLPDHPRQLHGMGRYDLKSGFGPFLTKLIDRDKALSVLREWILSPET
ncbi:MAG: hypothetical protein JSW27_08565 [Phycisphaerales bacterium]|nr:MAG: hypothetical protein JSW27_08565 [Phycisphaerales bacterium]